VNAICVLLSVGFRSSRLLEVVCPFVKRLMKTNEMSTLSRLTERLLFRNN
jgi:hypothetical protein